MGWRRHKRRRKVTRFKDGGKRTRKEEKDMVIGTITCGDYR